MRHPDKAESERGRAARPILAHKAPQFQSVRSTAPILAALAGAVLLILSAASVSAQTRVYLPDPADEDWSFLKESPREDWLDPLKYIPLGREDWFVTLSGQVRFRAEGFRVHATDERDSASDNYLLQRYLFGGDVRMGRRARVFGEIQSGLIQGKLRSPRPTDRNSMDLHQAFFEWRQPAGKSGRLSIKAGRQELSIGSTRLISASPGLNVKRSFDGVTLSFRTTNWTAATAVARLVGIAAGSFDDRPDPDQLFWGAAVARRSPRLQRGELGGYYLGVDRDVSRYAQGIGPERRHTAGVKWSGAGARLALNYDALFQWGSFNDTQIRAWAFATETSYRVSTRGWRPQVSARADIASGDRDGDDHVLQSFNPLFPGNSYSGAVGLLGPTNLTDFTPSVTFVPRGDINIGFEAPSYWRTSAGDGVYGTDLRLLFPPAAGSGRYVGTNPGVLVVWQATRHWQLQGVVTRFLSGRFLENTFVSSGFGFYSTSLVYRF